MKKIYQWTLAASLGLGMFACSDTVNVEPITAIGPDGALNTPAGINATLIGVYNGLQSGDRYNRDYIAFPEALSDNGEAVDNSGRLVGENRNNPGAQFVSWNEIYRDINRANLVIESVENGIQGLSQAEADRVLGEALFLRAFNYFDAARAYGYDPTNLQAATNRGSVPILLNGVITSDEIELPARATADEVYTQMSMDLQRAADLLTNANAPFFGNRAAAYGLLSRVNLYWGNYAGVVNAATNAINQGVGTPLEAANYAAGFTNPGANPEALFELVYADDEGTGVNESLASTFRSTPGFGDLIASNDLIAAYEAGDVRLGTFVVSDDPTSNGFGRMESNKYNGHNGIANVDNVTILRLSEVYLNRAEAHARLGNTADALADLNFIKTRRGIAAAAGLSGDALIMEIINERRRELAFEGHRWFDLKRLGWPVNKPVLGSSIAPDDFRILAPIPGNEISVNPNIEQNVGY